MTSDRENRNRSGNGIRIGFGFGIVVGLLALPALGRESQTPELDAERDQLIEKLQRGVEVEATTKRLAALVAERDRRVATTRAAQDKERNAMVARRAWQDEYKKTGDSEVSWRCTLRADPANPVASTESRFFGDWGKVVKKEKLRLAPKNELDDGEPITVYEVAGQARTYTFLGEKFSPKYQTFDASVGDWVVVCDASRGLDSRLPAPYNERQVTRSGFAVRVAKPPAIADKKKWNPIHITQSAFHSAIRDVKWKYPPDAYVLSHIDVAEDLGGGRWRIDAGSGTDWVLEVGATCKHKELLVPGHGVWAILGQQRFDKTLKKLVLVAEDLEDRYLTER